MLRLSSNAIFMGLNGSEARRRRKPPLQCLSSTRRYALPRHGHRLGAIKQGTTNTSPRPIRVSSEVPDIPCTGYHWLVRRVWALTRLTAAANERAIGARHLNHIPSAVGEETGFPWSVVAGRERKEPAHSQEPSATDTRLGASATDSLGVLRRRGPHRKVSPVAHFPPLARLQSGSRQAFANGPKGGRGAGTPGREITCIT